MLRIMLLVLVVAATIAIFMTTRRGREIAKRVGLRDRVAGAASSRDVDFLLEACGGDREEVERRLAYERERVPELSEADHYRRAIRRVLSARRDGQS